MKRLLHICLSTLILLLTACSESGIFPTPADEMDGGSATFFLSARDSYGIAVTTRAGGEDQPGDTTENEPADTIPQENGVAGKITALRYILADSEGTIISHHYASMASDFSRLTLEGLKSGRYSIMFLAAGKESANAATASPGHITDPWLVNEDSDRPVNSIHYYKKVDFSIGFDHAPVNEKVELDLAVARIDLSLDIDNPSLWRHVKSVRLSLDDVIPTSLNADGSYSGEQRITDFGLDADNMPLSLTMFPPEHPVSGLVEIVSTTDGGEDITTRYPFRDLSLGKGKVSRIKVGYRHPEKTSGRIYVAEDQIWRFPADTMFMADEPREVFYDNTRRSFYVNAPLQIGVDSSHSLLVRYFSPIPLKDVRVLGRFSKLSSEWFDLAYLETIPAFFEASLPLPVVSRECTFRTLSGRNIRIPAQPGLTSSELEVRFETEDEFMKKISTIDSRWYIRFSKYGADNGHANWRHMTPILCRHGVALALNMAYMFATQEFSDQLDTYDGILFDNSKNPIDLNALRGKIRNHGGLNLGCVAGVGGLGGGQTYGLADYCYTGVYHDATAPDSNPHNYPRQAMFHEYGHCLGYSHSSNMTYGDKWTVLCANVFVQLGKEGKLPVPNRTDVTSLPYVR